jgi:hypothetical protein
MPFLLLYIGEGQKFDQSLVTACLKELRGATQYSSPDYLSAYLFEKGPDSTTICLKKDQETIVIDGEGEASLSAALHIQADYPEDIRLIDECYNFNILLRGIASWQELERRIKESGG